MEVKKRSDTSSEGEDVTYWLMVEGGLYFVGTHRLDTIGDQRAAATIPLHNVPPRLYDVYPRSVLVADFLTVRADLLE